MTQYEKCLGSKAEFLKEHQAAVKAVIKAMIDAGVTDPRHARARLDWDQVSRDTLERVKKQQFVKKRPGFAHWPWEEYKLECGDLETNGMDKKGHVRWELDAVDGVKVLSSSVTHFECNEADELNTRNSSTDANLTANDMVTLQDALMAAVLAQAKGDEQAGFDAGMKRLYARDDSAPASSTAGAGKKAKAA
eukprot:7557980-Pyramimonas_sp.AAC.1